MEDRKVVVSSGSVGGFADTHVQKRIRDIELVQFGNGPQAEEPSHGYGEESDLCSKCWAWVQSTAGLMGSTIRSGLTSEFRQSAGWKMVIGCSESSGRSSSPSTHHPCIDLSCLGRLPLVELFVGCLTPPLASRVDLILHCHRLCIVTSNHETKCCRG